MYKDKVKIKTILFAMAAAIGSTTAIAANPYVAGTQYHGGDQVTNDGAIFECQSEQVAAWCSSSAAWAYAPGTGIAWQTAWKEVDGGGSDPQPDPDPKPQPGKVCQGEGAFDAKEFAIRAWPNDHYGSSDGISEYATYNGNLWHAKWWTASVPGNDPAWEKCAPITIGTVIIKADNLPNKDKFDIKIGDKSYTVSKSGSSIELPKGDYSVSVDSIIDINNNTYYQAKNIDDLHINEKGNYELTIHFSKSQLPVKQYEFYVKFEGDHPSSFPSLAIDGMDNSYHLDTTSYMTDHKLKIELPVFGSYEFKPGSYKVGNDIYTANTISIINGEFDGVNVMTYQKEEFPAKVVGGYTTTWDKKIPNLNDMADEGYNVAVLAFAKVDGTKVGLFDDAKIGTGNDVTWKFDYQAKDAPLVIMSFGGINYENTWKPDLSDQGIKEIAKNTVNFLAENHLNGVDFDLELTSPGIDDQNVSVVDGKQTYPKITALISAIRKEANIRKNDFPGGFYITAAPQTSGNDLYWAASGNKSFDSMLDPKACDGNTCFDALFVQNYNSARMSPEKAYDITTNLLAKSGNKTTKFVMGYDLAPGEWSGNYPVSVNGETLDKPAEIAQKFDQSNRGVNGAFVWQAEHDEENNYQFAHEVGQQFGTYRNS